MALSETTPSQYLLPSVPPGATTEGSVPSNKVPLNLSNFSLPYHYDIRAFREPLKGMTLTNLDLAYHSDDFWDDLSVTGPQEIDIYAVGNENWISGGLDQDALDLKTQAELDLLSQSQIENSEGIGKVIAWLYQSGVNLSVGTSGRTLISNYDSDNLLQYPFNDPNKDYFVELVLRDFPSQAITPHLDLDNSFIAFSDSNNLDPARTDVFAFSDSLNDLTGGGNLTWKINRDSFTNCDITQIYRIDIYLESVGGTMTFKAEALRLVPEDYPYYKVGVNTKAGILKRIPSAKGTAVETQTNLPVIVDTTTNKTANVTEIVKFNTGHHPVDPIHNQFSVFLRSEEGSGQYVEVTTKMNDTETVIQIYEGGTGLRQVVSDTVLDESTDYFLEINLYENVLRAIIWTVNGNYPDSVVINTESSGIINVSRSDPGYIGYSMDAYMADFFIDYMFAKDTILAEMESKIYQSITPVDGVTLYTNSSPPLQLLDTNSIAEGPAINKFVSSYDDSGLDSGGINIVAGANDVVVTSDSEIVATENGTSYKVRKQLANAWLAGLQWNTPIIISNTENAAIRGKIRFSPDLLAANGEFRVVFFDRWTEHVATLFRIPVANLTVNVWNDFEFFLSNYNIYNNEFILQIHHVGTSSTASPTDSNAIGTFWVDEVEVETASVSWEASNDGGLTWIKFLDTIGQQYQGINFPEYNNLLKIKAKAFTSTAWISQYEAKVSYAQPGRILE